MLSLLALPSDCYKTSNMLTDMLAVLEQAVQSFLQYFTQGRERKRKEKNLMFWQWK